MDGADVKELQSLLIQLDYDLGKWGADGDFGDATEIAVRALQQRMKISADGIVGTATIKALDAALKIEDGDGAPENARYVRVKGGNAFVRSEPDKTKDNKLGVAYEGKLLPYKGETTVDGWYGVEFDGKDGWISGKYGRLEA
jgi:N-acetylmuramoyl-L-alanine amidase